jgi:hypothetical protein
MSAAAGAIRGAPLRDYPTAAADGVRGLRFIAAAVQSACAGSTWLTV